jgi:putative heme-binding domain-containing protein
MDALFQRQDRLLPLLEALEAGVVPIASLEPIRRAQLLENPRDQIRQRAQKLLAGEHIRQDRREVTARYTAALASSRSAERGRKVYETHCAKCHQVAGSGHVVGPDLSSTTRRTDEMLVADVLDPSNQITVGFNSYTVLTEEGRIYSGVLSAETATSVTLRREESAEDTILRRNIDEMAASPISMMPENLEKEVTAQDLVDLIAFLREAFGAPSTHITLFEDERSFVELLTQGEGRVILETADAFSGTAALLVTPPQRWNVEIPGWAYPIRENPGPGEYRYLRLAWKSRGGTGVMIELADRGRWPGAEEPLRRYYSGENQTPWAATQVATENPREWTEVTCDLWKDFGDFTLTGIAPTAIGGEALFDRIQLWRTLNE